MAVNSWELIGVLCTLSIPPIAIYTLGQTAMYGFTTTVKVSVCLIFILLFLGLEAVQRKESHNGGVYRP